MDRQQLFDRLRTTQNRLRILGIGILLQTTAYLADMPPRNSLPEPFDIGTHQGNGTNSLIIGAVAGRAAAHAVDRLAPDVSPRTTRGAILVGAVAVGVIFNGFIENKFGQRVLDNELLQSINGSRTTGDPLDMAYGTIAAGVASFAITSEQPKDPSPTAP